MGDLQVGSKFKTSAVGIVTTSKPTYAEWEIALSVSCDLHRSSQWWIGDLLNIGNSTYGEKYTQALEDTGFEEGYLRNLKYVAERVQLSLRSDKLSFGHHQLVAPLEPDEQKKWITLAVNNKWTRAQMNEAMKGDESTGTSDGDPGEGDGLEAIIAEFGEYLDGLADNRARAAALKQMFARITALAKRYGLGRTA